MRVHPCPHLHPPFFPTSASQSLARSSQRLSCYLRAVHCPQSQQGYNARTHTQPITHGRQITFSPSPPPPFFLSLLAQSAPSNNNQESRDVVGTAPFHKPLRSPTHHPLTLPFHRFLSSFLSLSHAHPPSSYSARRTPHGGDTPPNAGPIGPACVSFWPRRLRPSDGWTSTRHPSSSSSSCRCPPTRIRRRPRSGAWADG